MKLHEWPWITLRTATGICSLFVSLHGLWNIYGLDFRIDTAISVLYCLLPFLSFFVFLFVRKAPREITAHAVIACGYIAAYAFLNWRTCSAFGYCTTMPATVLLTMRTKPILAACAVVLLSAATFLLDTHHRSRPASN
jgi:hypothetical protein